MAKSKRTNLKPNLLERGIAYFSPSYALQRTQDRVANEAIRAYNAASRGRRTANWRATGASQNSEVLAAGAVLRNRSRELGRNNPFAKKALQSITTNTIGTGIKAKIVSDKPRPQKKAQLAWNEWANSTACDFNDFKNFYGIQSLVMRTVAESGDCLILKRRNKDNKIPIELQVVEIEHLDVSKTSNNSDGSFIFMGIEFDKKGKRVAYWLFNQHTGDSYHIGENKSKRIPATDVIHVFEQLRPEQQLGVPFGASAMMKMRDLDEFSDAEIVRQKIAACYAVFIRRDGDAGAVVDQEVIDEIERVEPGMVTMLSKDDSIETADPPNVDSFADFFKSSMQGAAAGYGTTYENVTGDLSNVNFSSGRMGWIEFHRNVQEWQNNMIIPMLCDKVWEWFKEASVLSNIDLNNVSTSWTPPRREMIDPVKETKGLMDAVKGGLISMPDAIIRQGQDPQETLDEIEAWNKELDEREIILESDPRQKIKAKEQAGRPSKDNKNVDDNEDKK